MAVCHRNVAGGGAQLEFSDDLASTDPSDLGFQGKVPLAVCNRNVAGDGTKLRFSDELTSVDVTYVGANFHICLGRHSYLEVYLACQLVSSCAQTPSLLLGCDLNSVALLGNFIFHPIRFVYLSCNLYIRGTINSYQLHRSCKDVDG